MTDVEGRCRPRALGNAPGNVAGSCRSAGGDRRGAEAGRAAHPGPERRRWCSRAAGPVDRLDTCIGIRDVRVTTAA